MITTPKSLAECLPQSHHYETGRLVCVITDDNGSENYYQISRINEFHFTDEVMMYLEKINDFGLRPTEELVKSAERIKEVLE